VTESNSNTGGKKEKGVNKWETSDIQGLSTLRRSNATHTYRRDKANVEETSEEREEKHNFR